MTLKEAQQPMITCVSLSLAENNQRIDNNFTADYLAVTNSNFIMQGDNYSQFLESVNNWYDQDNFCYDDCMLLALYPYMDIIDFIED